MPELDVVVDGIVKREGGYVDNAADRGGKTNFGITEAVARENGYKGLMEAMPRTFAEGVYKKRYIALPKFDRVYEQSRLVGLELIDTGVNMGPSVAATWFQRWLNGFNVDGSKYADVFVDGRIGDVTLNAFAAYLAQRGHEGEVVMHDALNSSQGARYLELAETRKTQRQFLYGWVRARVGMA